MEPLIEIPCNEWLQLRDLYTVDWPQGAAAYCLLDTQINCPKLCDNFNFKIYCPFGDLNSGMVGLTVKSGHTQVIIQPLNDVMKIEEALLSTKIIDWNRSVMVPFSSPEATECLIRLSNRMNIKINYKDGKAIEHLLDKSCIPFNISFPDNTYIASLKPEHIDIVDKTWTYYSEHSNEFFETLMENDMTYVLYSSEDDKPMAWITINEAGALTHLFCLEPFRRKGYAELVTKFACNDLLKKGRHVIAYTIEDNDNSQRLLDKLGFQDIGYDYWVSIENKY